MKTEGGQESQPRLPGGRALGKIDVDLLSAGWPVSIGFGRSVRSRWLVWATGASCLAAPSLSDGLGAQAALTNRQVARSVGGGGVHERVLLLLLLLLLFVLGLVAVVIRFSFL